MFGLFLRPIFEGISPENDQQDHSSKVTWASLKNIQTPVMSTFKWFPGIKKRDYVMIVVKIPMVVVKIPIP